jgi:hypothetical protein
MDEKMKQAVSQYDFQISKDKLKEVFDEYGSEILQEPHNFYANLIDQLPYNEKERNILDIAVKNVGTTLHKAMNEPDDEKKRVAILSVHRLSTDFGQNEESALFSVACITNALGWPQFEYTEAANRSGATSSQSINFFKSKVGLLVGIVVLAIVLVAVAILLYGLYNKENSASVKSPESTVKKDSTNSNTYTNKDVDALGAGREIPTEQDISDESRLKSGVNVDFTENLHIATPAEYITFNQYIDNKVWGNEHDFVRVGPTYINSISELKENVVAVEGQEYYVYMFVHNNAASWLNLTANNVEVQIARVSTAAGTTQQLRGFIDAGNCGAKPDGKGGQTAGSVGTFWDGAGFQSMDDRKFVMEYVKGSAVYMNNAGTFTLPDTVATTNGNNGTLVGDTAMDGNIPGCLDHAGLVIIRVKPKYESV